ACSASAGRSRETNAYFGKRRRKVEVLPVCLAPVSTTTGRVFAERCRRGSTARGIHICKIYDRIAYCARPGEFAYLIPHCVSKRVLSIRRRLRLPRLCLPKLRGDFEHYSVAELTATRSRTVEVPVRIHDQCGIGECPVRRYPAKAVQHGLGAARSQLEYRSTAWRELPRAGASPSRQRRAVKITLGVQEQPRRWTCSIRAT